MITGRFDTILFDLDGTLVDSAPLIAEILNDMRLHRRLPPIPLNLYRQWSSLGGSYLIAKSLEETDSNAIADLVQKFRNRYCELPTPIDSLYIGAEETIIELSRLGVRIGLCSNKPEYLCRKVLTETGIIEYFKCIIGGGTVSKSKPNREPIDHALYLLKRSSSSCIFVGDSTVDQEAAHDAEIPFIFFSEGYNDGVSIEKAYMCINSLSSLIDIFK